MIMVPLEIRRTQGDIQASDRPASLNCALPSPRFMLPELLKHSHALSWCGKIDLMRSSAPNLAASLISMLYSKSRSAVNRRHAVELIVLGL